jgi:4-oxalocrotonate tautomerase family enzyme
MPTIRMQWLNTRTEKQRRELAKRFTQAMVDVVGISKDMVHVIFDEVDPRMHAKGGVFYSDVLKKAPAKRAAAKKTPAKRTAAKKAPAKRATTRRAPAARKR